MAKRKRLTPANPDFLEVQEKSPVPGLSRAEVEEALRPEPMPEDLETKGYPLGVAPTRTRPKPPIAQVAGDTSASAALQELADEMTRARDEGRLVQSLALAEIDAAHLVRDRLVAEEEELAALMESLRRRGQQTPIEVVDRGQGAHPRYGLISGWRRMAALTRLVAEDPAFGQVLALIRAPKSASEAYVAMVEENEIRVGLSYYERARIVLKSVEQGVYPDLKTALNTLFGNVSRAKRSKIKSFTRLVEALDGALTFPTAIGERLGLDLAKRLDEAPELEAELRAALAAAPAESAEEEQHVLGAMPVISSSSAAPADTPRAEVTTRGGVRIRYDMSKGRAVLDGLDAGTHAALLDWLECR